MKDLYFGDIESLVCDIADKYDSLTDEYADVSVIAKYDKAKEIIKELLCMGYEIASIDIHREEFEEYWDEYIISLNFDGVWCEKYKRDKGYFEEDSAVTYISNECSSAIIPHVKSKMVYAFEICDEDEYAEEYDDCECDCCDCVGNNVCEKSDTKETSDSKDSERYYINDKPASKEEYFKAVQKFDEEFKDILQDGLIQHCRIMDGLNDLLSAFRW